jgi:hypothetical protein
LVGLFSEYGSRGSNADQACEQTALNDPGDLDDQVDQTFGLSSAREGRRSVISIDQRDLIGNEREQGSGFISLRSAMK